jgi:MFS family permease
MLATLGFAVQAVSGLMLGFVSDRWTRGGRSEALFRRATISAAHLIYGVCIIAVPLVHSLTAVAVLLCVLGACGGSMALNIYAIAQMFAGPRASGTWVGIQNAVGNVSGIVGPAISGIIIDRAGYGSAFGLAAAVSIFGGVWWAFGVPRIRQIELD